MMIDNAFIAAPPKLPVETPHRAALHVVAAVQPAIPCQQSAFEVPSKGRSIQEQEKP